MIEQKDKTLASKFGSLTSRAKDRKAEYCEQEQLKIQQQALPQSLPQTVDM
jgi:hypothetical protein